MPLMTCPECKKEVSDQASSCPGCGLPMKKAEVVIEKTSKEIKETELLFVGLAVLGMLMAVAGMWLGGFFLFAGILGFTGAKFAEWWKHG